MKLSNEYENFTAEKALKLSLEFETPYSEEDIYTFIIDDIKESAGNGEKTLFVDFQEYHVYSYKDITATIIEKLEEKGFSVSIDESQLVVSYKVN